MNKLFKCPHCDEKFYIVTNEDGTFDVHPFCIENATDNILKNNKVAFGMIYSDNSERKEETI